MTRGKSMTTTTTEYRPRSRRDASQPANERRADLAEAMLLTGTDCEGERNAELVATDVSDALSHFIHLCRRAGLDWRATVDRAERAAIGDLEDGAEAKRDSDRFPFPDESEDEDAKARATCSGCLARTYRDEECVCLDGGDAEC
jgi:hypothetical protein